MDEKYIYQTIERVQMVMDWLCNNNDSCELCEGYFVSDGSKECALDRVKGALMKAAQRVSKDENRIEVTVDTDTAETALMLLDTLQAKYCVQSKSCPHCDVHIADELGEKGCPFDTVRQKFCKEYFGV